MAAMFFSCKKKEECPAPKAGQVIINDVPGQYSGYFTTTIDYIHGLNYKDTTITTRMYFHDIPTNNYESTTHLVNSAEVNGNLLYNSSFSYYQSLMYDSVNAISLIGMFNHLNYNFSSSVFGTISLNDNRVGGNFSNIAAIPLNFSNSTPYSINLNNVTNCTKVLIEIANGVGIVERTVLPANAAAQFHATEFLNTTSGNITGLNISLINSLDTIINGSKFKLEKIIRHRYGITFTN